jgi:hypothetical protein
MGLLQSAVVRIFDTHQTGLLAAETSLSKLVYLTTLQFETKQKSRNT